MGMAALFPAIGDGGDGTTVGAIVAKLTVTDPACCRTFDVGFVTAAATAFVVAVASLVVIFVSTTTDPLHDDIRSLYLRWEFAFDTGREGRRN